ncbi:nicotinamide riboside transporter PnuC [Paenibacillus psychroresistens]|uniref:Nicotinamide riboside transporter PnuC n=2 Tax=Paenibacillus psychroresistens TaxID=1778678 RepID=A0A6B8RVW2_9BACL|nr:nicotinamide riboside transporter PnuC [Paenibacillus psychroresistens]
MDKPSTMFGLLAIMLIIAYFTASTALEIVATTTGLLSVWLTTRESIWCMPMGLINVACFFCSFYDAKLYADMTLQVFFFVLGIWGWYVWLTKRYTAKVRPTKRIEAKMIILLSILIIAGTGGWGYLLTEYTDASIPYADAFIAILSVIAQFLLSSKVLEHWLVWIVVDVLSIGMYFYKGLDTIAFLYIIYLFIAIAGWFGWKNGYQKSLAT